MKTCLNYLALLLAMITSLSLLLAGRATAQTFTLLHTFAGLPSDSGNPNAFLILSSNILYGTASGTLCPGDGVVFAINSDGTGYTNLHSMAATPYGGLVLSSNTLYGTTSDGGSGRGTVFAVNTDGTGFTNLHSFAGPPDDGSGPSAELVLSGRTLYGTASSGGSWGNGTVFAINTDGTGFTNLHIFQNNDGSLPSGGLILSGDNLYGTAQGGGDFDHGTVFAVHTNGTGFTVLHSFSGFTDGSTPLSHLVLAGNTLYGTTYSGGTGEGTVFAVNTNGTGFTNLHVFTAASGSLSTNSDGAFPGGGGLILSGNTLFGTASAGGGSGNGTIFAVNTDGTGFTTLHSFPAGSGTQPFLANSDGALPYGGLILSGNTLYGTAFTGGSSSYGTVFSLVLPPPPQLTIIPSGANVILQWPTNALGFTLQSTTNLVAPTIWSTVLPAPTILSGQNTVTNPVSGDQKYYRLIQ